MSNFIPMFKYFWLTIKHKWFVFLAGLKVGCPIWRLITHDLSKFSLYELPHYGRQFFGEKNDPDGFIKCWVHHQNKNDHHWEYWIPRTGHNRCYPPYKDNLPIYMERGAMAEMVADWIGASRAYEGRWPNANNWEWFISNFDKIRLHPKTREEVLIKLFAHDIEVETSGKLLSKCIFG